MSYKIEIRDDISEDQLVFSVVQSGVRIALFRDVEDAKTFIEARTEVGLNESESRSISGVARKEETADLEI